MINWHRLFGLFLMDFFSDSPYEVELEKDLSLKQQFLDIVIVRKTHEGEVPELPDGFETLKAHNLISYKSLHEAFDGWALKELIGHYVNYRKQVSPSLHKLLPENQFQLYAISTRHPVKLKREIDLQPVTDGVYDIALGIDTVRLIVLSEMAAYQHNAVLRLFSAQPDAIIQAHDHYKPRQSDMSTIVQQLIETYQREHIVMSYTKQDFQKDYVLEHLNLLSPDEVLKRYSPDEVLKRYSPDDRLKNLSPDDIVKHLSPGDAEKLMDTLIALSRKK